MGIYYELYRSRGIKLVFTYFWNAHLFDLINGTDTHNMRPREELFSRLGNIQNTAPYMVSWTKTLRDTQNHIAKLNIDLSEFTFVDYGCGKGKAILWSQKKDILNLRNNYLGIDFDESLINIARANARKMKLNSDVFYHNNVLNFPYYSSPEISYLYNPFDEIVLKKLLTTLKKRAKFVIYINPIHRQLFIDTGFRTHIRRNSWHANLSYEILVNESI